MSIVSSSGSTNTFGFGGALCLLGSLSKGGIISDSLEFLVVLGFTAFTSKEVANDDGAANDFLGAVLTAPQFPI